MNLQVVQEILNIAFQAGKFSLFAFIIGMFMISILMLLSVIDIWIVRVPATIALCVVNIISNIMLFILKVSLFVGIVSWLILRFA